MLNMNLFTPGDMARFWGKVERSPNDDGCWLWLACRTSKGYGRFGWHGQAVYAHRITYVMTHGNPDPWLVIDHLCRNPSCVNPAHLEAVEHEENLRRGLIWDFHSAKTHCPHGHPYAGDNLILEKRRDGDRRVCRECQVAKGRRLRATQEFKEKRLAYEAAHRTEGRERLRRWRAAKKATEAT